MNYLLITYHLLQGGEKMQKLLKRQQGFTLVELLVVIAIIAILAVIGLTVFTGLQRGARDAQRRADVEAISKALEANYNTATALYIPLATNQFAGQVIPVDPLNGAVSCNTAICKYCITEVTGGGVNPTGAACAAGTQVVAAGQPTAAATGYVVCTNLEASTVGAFYCRGNQR